MALMNPTKLDDWLSPHSKEWYKQLGALEGKYLYSWNSSHSEPNAETIFDEEVARMIENQKVLDIGCGHGDFTIKCSEIAKKIVGFDITDGFVQVGLGLANKKPNVSFIVGNTKDGLPFKTDEFDCAYIRKGPTSAYPYLKGIVKEGGCVIGMHPGDDSGKELADLFPKLFEPVYGTPILETIKERLANSNFSITSLEVLNSVEYIESPIDVLKLRCFGQKPSIYKLLYEKNLSEVTNIFEQNATNEGLPITFSRYLIRVIV
ncbi:class I SAM-dependent methyltransferase [Ureibacillus aquaedulcis]|uniref:Methyltransferase domain-containing protein n=1 Tax=Ureibacillus aquaedulcis TaxID=3058421 RepID=A0ABT8GQD6_9BACL|nr:class I SAM-dependent methyltransferase [Ureibacillus sp. BA0131]MDN4493564.1 methyltransferase domain-containing protein [Ureibacillus sp. BA0131]